MKRLSFLLVALLFIAALAPLSARAQGDKATTVTMAFFEAEPQGLDPQAIQTLDEFQAAYNIYEGLVTYDPKTLEPVPLLAEKWDVSKDNLVYTFHLRKGVKFQNGREMTADDVKFSLERLGNPDTGTSYTSLMLNSVKGFNDMRDKDKKAKTLEGVKVIDPQTVEITLTAPVGSFLKQLTMPGGFIVPKEATTDAKTFAQKPVGTGPYKLKEWVRQDHMTLEANAGYWGGAPAVKTAIIRVIPQASQQVIEYEGGNIDIAIAPETDLARLKADAKLSKELQDVPIQSTFFFRVNLKDPVTGKAEVRQAIAYAIDRDAIIKTVLAGQGTPAQGLFPSGFSAFDKNYNPYPHDIQKAKDLLAKAGYKDGVDVEVRTGQVETENRVLQAIQQQVADAGIRLKINSTDASLYSKDRADCKMQLGTISYSQDYADADDFTPQIFRTSGGLMKCGYDSYPGATDIQKELNDASAMPLGPDRDAAYRKIEKQAIDLAVIIPIYHGTRTVLVNPRIGGVAVDNNSIVQFKAIKVS